MPRRDSGNGAPVRAARREEAAPAADSPRLWRWEGTLRRWWQRVQKFRVAVLAGLHLILFAVVYRLAFELRFDFDLSTETRNLFWSSLPWVVGLKFFVFYFCRQFHTWWRYVTFSDSLSLARASVLALLVVGATDHFVVSAFQHPRVHIPRSVLLIDFLVGLVLLGALRAGWRTFRENFQPILNKNGIRWALMVGADHNSAILAYQMQSYLGVPYRVRGFVATTDESGKKGTFLGQIPILGTLDEIVQLAATYAISDVLVTTDALIGPQLRQLMETCRKAKLNLKIIRSAEDRLGGDEKVPIRDIEISDLLRREPVALDMESIGHLLRGRRVLVTGAGGSIGSEICRQMLPFQPACLILLGRGENRIFAIERELHRLAPEVPLCPCIADVTNASRMREIFAAHRPEVVFHAAAHKHVPLMETNAGEAIRNNVLGTQCVADLAHAHGVWSFVYISTDKVVNPTSIMGVSKQLAERYIHALSQESETRFTVVRFGNVLGSTGSVVPIFQEQIRLGGPITITDERMVRFFMTIPEASQLVLQAAAMGQGGEIFVLDMGEPVKIVDLARDLVRLSGLPEEAIQITFTGVRPGEKLHEELYFEDERMLPTSHPKVRAAYHRPYSLAEVRRAIEELSGLLHGPEDLLRQKLHELVPEYRPNGLLAAPNIAPKTAPAVPCPAAPAKPVV